MGYPQLTVTKVRLSFFCTNLTCNIRYVATPLHILHLFVDADECTLFGQEVCKDGFCLDTVGSYECYCKTGQDYDPAKLECRGLMNRKTVCLSVYACVYEIQLSPYIFE